VRGKWRASFLSTFSDALHMRAGAEVDGISVEADQLGQAQAGLGPGCVKMAPYQRQSLARQWVL
jgi:hypothetical protein